MFIVSFLTYFFFLVHFSIFKDLLIYPRAGQKKQKATKKTTCFFSRLLFFFFCRLIGVFLVAFLCFFVAFLFGDVAPRRSCRLFEAVAQLRSRHTAFRLPFAEAIPRQRFRLTEASGYLR